MERLSAPERTREELRALMNGELGTAAGRSIWFVLRCDRGMLSPLGSPALPGAPDAQSRGQGLGRSLAGIQGSGYGLLSGVFARDCAPTGGWHPRRLRRSPAERVRLFRGRFRGMYRASAGACHAPPFCSNDQPAVRRGTATAENHCQRLRQEARAQTHARRSIRAVERWRGLRFTEFELRQIAAVRKDLNDGYQTSITSWPARSSQSRVSSKSMP